jgi:amidase
LTIYREHGEEEVSEFTINKVECYYLMKEYLSKLKNTNMKTVEDVVRFNDENAGSQGANPGDHPAFPSGQVRRRRHLRSETPY